MGCANHYTTRASRNEFSNVGAIEVGLHAAQVPNSCRKWHTIYILVLIHNPLYMSHTTLRWVVNVSRFPPVPLQIEVWAVSNLTFVLLSFAILHSTIEVPFIVLVLYFHRSDTLKRVNGDATIAVCRQGKYVSVALHATANCIWIHEMIVRNTMKQKLLTYLFLNEIHVVEMCEVGRYKSFVRITIYSAMWYYLWGVQFM